MQLSALWLTLGVLVLPVLPLILAWTRWLRTESKLVVGPRKAAFLVGIVSTSVACLPATGRNSTHFNIYDPNGLERAILPSPKWSGNVHVGEYYPGTSLLDHLLHDWLGL